MTATTLVIDASVAVKWFIVDEAHMTQARKLLGDSLNLEFRLVGPPLFFAEATNALYHRLRRKDLTERQIDMVVASLWTQRVDTLNPVHLTQRAYQLVRQHRLANVYDSHYGVLAQELGAQFWTGDRRVFNSIGPVAPWIRWIGDYGSENGDG